MAIKKIIFHWTVWYLFHVNETKKQKSKKNFGIEPKFIYFKTIDLDNKFYIELTKEDTVEKIELKKKQFPVDRIKDQPKNRRRPVKIERFWKNKETFWSNEWDKKKKKSIEFIRLELNLEIRDIYVGNKSLYFWE